MLRLLIYFEKFYFPNNTQVIYFLKIYFDHRIGIVLIAHCSRALCCDLYENQF